MPKDLGRIKTIAIAMMENRSFDHLLGYLSLSDSGHPNWQRIEGVRQATDFYAHTAFPVRPLTNLTISPDPLHERENIEVQISQNPYGPMKGFTEAYKAAFTPYKQGDPIERVMEYCRKGDITTTDYLARNFAICDEWFAPLPASTLPNRLVAFSGFALVDRTPVNVIQVLKNFALFGRYTDDNVYDWLGNRSIDWRVYHSGTPFFMMEPSFFQRYRADQHNQFRSIFDLRTDVINNDVASVMFLEPRYWNDPRRDSLAATDDHPTASLAGGQGFLKMVFDGLSAKPEVWESLTLIITYDEHGSFFDHIPPRPIASPVVDNLHYKPFDTTGLRVPSIVVSPFVEPGSVCETLFDHTSILKLLGEKFGNRHYTDLVDARPVNSLSEVLSDRRLDASFQVQPPPPTPWA